MKIGQKQAALRLDSDAEKTSKVGPLGQGLPPKLLDTPGMRQYLEIKKDHLDAFLFYRMGDFYELFLKDAVEGAKLLDIALTSRSSKNSDEKIPMAGVPQHSVATYVNQLTSLGYKVAICEQIQDPALAKGIVERKVVRIVSPGLTYDADTLDSSENVYLVSLWFSAVSARVFERGASLALVDLTTGEFKTAEFTGENFRSALALELGRINPREIILRERDAEDPLVKEYIRKYSSVLVSKVADSSFRAEAATEELKNLYTVKTLSGFGLKDESVEVRAAGALIRYLRNTQLDYGISHLKIPKRIADAQHMHLDEATMEALDLLPKGIGLDRRFGKEGTSFFESLDSTHTPMGKRLLKSWIKYPLLNVERIKQRQSLIRGFLEDGYLASELETLISGIVDIERIYSKISMGTALPSDLIRFKNSILPIHQIFQIISKTSKKDGSLAALRSLVKNKADLKELAENLDSTLAEPPPAGLRDGKLLKEGVCEKRDEYYQLVENSKELLIQIEQKEREKSGIANLKIKYNRVFGYFIEITKSQLAKVPKHYERRQTMVNAERFITPELKEFQVKSQEAENELVRLEVEQWSALIEIIRKSKTEILEAAQLIATLDVILCLSKMASRWNWVCPQVRDSEEKASNPIEIAQGRHPVIESIIGSADFVPNTVNLNSKSNRLLLITGPNMAGKSTIMRQTALIVLLAQIGSYVPAEVASISIVDRIFTRIGASDNIASGQSTFMVEMSETANILNNATERSLILLDEVGRGTSTYDGLSIAWALAEFIHEKVKAKTLFATHYHELTELEARFEGIKNVQVSVTEEDGEVRFLHKLVDGAAPGSYGIHVARLAGVPEKILQRASNVLVELEKQGGENFQNNPINSDQLDLFFQSDATKIKQDRDNEAQLNQLRILNESLNEILEEIRGIDLMKTPPLDTLRIISEIQEDLRELDS